LASLKIPDHYASGLAALARLTDEAFEGFLPALSTIPPSLNSGVIASHVSPKVSSVSEGDVKQIARTLLSLYSARASLDFSIPHFVEEINRAMDQSERTELHLIGDDRARFKNRLESLLDIPVLSTASKAFSIQKEHDRTFCTARIFTDARPVYQDDPSENPSASVITHMLKLSYHEGSKPLKYFYVAMDGKDLAELKDLITRAEAKAESLGKTLTSAGIAVIEPD
jgi:hypothetical protein